MSSKTRPLDYWRKFFRASDADIFEVIEYAILVAANDCPKEFRIRRDSIAQKLYTCRLIRCCECDSVTLHTHEDDEKAGLQGGFEGGFHGKESKVNSSTTNVGDDRNRISNYSYDEAEALTEEIEEETQIVGEVLRIRDVLENPDESDHVLFESLRRLQLMELSFETLKDTEIGKAVNGLRKRGSKQIRNLARTLVCGWKEIVDQWVSAANAVAGDSPDSVKPSSIEEEEGLPSPPMDGELFLATQTTSMELSQFFDGMDDDGNPRGNIDIVDKNYNIRKSTPENQNPWRRPPSSEGNLSKEEKYPMRKQEIVNKQTEPSGTRIQARDLGPGRPQKLNTQNKTNGDSKFQQRSDPVGIQRKPPTGLQDKPKRSEDVLEKMKLEATKRKLQEGYQLAENAKKQRTIQVMELHDLPKQGLGHKNAHFKPGLHNRHWNHGHN